jgi:hypothetical protein
MMTGRASVFDNDTDFDVSGFAPKQEKRGGEAPPEIVRAVSQTASFRSREPLQPQATPKPEPQKREPRRYRTGRNVQLNIKVRAETIESFYALADKEGWVLGETFERAIAALKKELAATSKIA